MMGHDYEHCLDQTASCPDKCFRKKLNEDLKRNPQPFVSWMHLKDTKLCIKKRKVEEGE